MPCKCDFLLAGGVLRPAGNMNGTMSSVALARQPKGSLLLPIYRWLLTAGSLVHSNDYNFGKIRKMPL